MKKGNITLAIQEAVKDWIKKRRITRSQAARKVWETRKAKGQQQIGSSASQP